MAEEKIKVSWDELSSSSVDEKLKRQQGLAEAQKQYQTAPAPEALHRHKRTSLFYNSLVYMGLFGLVGGLLGWACGQVLHLRPDLRTQADELIAQRRVVLQNKEKKLLDAAEAQVALDDIRAIGRNNPYFQIEQDATLPAARKDEARRRLMEQERVKDFVAKLLFYGVSGLMISLFLSMAESVVERNIPAAILHGSIGAMLGLLGGILVALFHDRVYQFMAGDPATAANWRRLIAEAARWGLLGCFLSIAPGLVMRNGKRLAIGVAGGLVGGIIGGLLFEPIMRWTGSIQIARLAGILAIGLIAGIGTGLFENVAKTGWVKVLAGLIAGKQFILYRNPTYLGSSPHCQIYLFKDPQVGKRHAAIHVIKGGFEIEDLPLGGPTLLNGKPVARALLRHGDRIQVGTFSFLFQEKAHTA